MSVTAVTFEQVLSLAQRLRPIDQARLVARLAPQVEQIIERVESTSSPPSLRGLLADLGMAPSAEEIDEVQGEMWATLSESQRNSRTA